MIGRYHKVVLDSAPEALECAFSLVELNYNHLEPHFEDDYNQIFIDTENKEFFLTNTAGMRVVELISETRDKSNVEESILENIVKWQQKKNQTTLQ